MTTPYNTVPGYAGMVVVAFRYSAANVWQALTTHIPGPYYGVLCRSAAS